MEIANSRVTFSRLEDDEKGVTITDTLGGKQEVQIIFESGLYTVILRSRSEKAKTFRRWITHDVIPTIRKKGYYSTLTDERLLQLLAEKALDDKAIELFLYKVRPAAIKEKIKDRQSELAWELYQNREKHTYQSYRRELAKIYPETSKAFSKEWRKRFKDVCLLPFEKN